MKIYVIVSCSHTIIRRGCCLPSLFSGHHLPLSCPHMVFQHCKSSAAPPGFSRIWMLCHSILRTHHIPSPPTSRPALSPIRTGRLRLQPIKKRQIQLTSSFYSPFHFFLGYIDQISHEIIILWPVDDGDISFISSFQKVMPIDQPPIQP